MVPNDIIWLVIGWLVIGVIAVVILALTALIFAPFLVRIFRQRSVSKELAASGVIAPATLVSMQQGGVKITYGGVDERWQADLLLQVQPADGPVFQAQAAHVIPVLEISQYQPGTTLVVAYDPADRSKVAVLRNLGVLANVVQATGMEPQAAHRLLIDSELLYADLERKGALAPAEIIAADKVGVQVYNGTGELMRLTLEVRPPQDIPFRAQTNAIVSLASMAKYQPGAAVTVRYDPQDPRRVTVEGSG